MFGTPTNPFGSRSTSTYFLRNFKRKCEISKGISYCKTVYPSGFCAITYFGIILRFALCCTLKKACKEKAWKKADAILGKRNESTRFDWVLVSTQKNENAQYFYRAIGYIDCGNLTAPDQTVELLLNKRLSN